MHGFSEFSKALFPLPPHRPLPSLSGSDLRKRRISKVWEIEDKFIPVKDDCFFFFPFFHYLSSNKLRYSIASSVISIASQQYQYIAWVLYLGNPSDMDMGVIIFSRLGKTIWFFHRCLV